MFHNCYLRLFKEQACSQLQPTPHVLVSEHPLLNFS
jgi:hypothetical protein